MDKLLKELRALMAFLTEYRALDPEGRTEEKRAEMQTKLERLKVVEEEIRELKAIDDAEERNSQSINGTPPGQGGDGTIEVPDQPVYRSLFPLGEQMADISAVASGSTNAGAARSRLNQVFNREKALAEERAAGTGGMLAATGPEGGHLLQGETSFEMVTNGFNNNEILSRTDNITTSSQFIDVVGINETSRVKGSRGAGIQVYTDKELVGIEQSKTKLKKIRIEPKRLTGMYFASTEILNDAPALEGEMSTLFNEEFAFKGQELAMVGSGSGEALGALTSKALVTVAKETDQAAKTINAQNVIKMLSRVMMKNLKNLVWTVNQDCIPQLYEIILTVGDKNIALFVPNNNTAGSGSIGTLLGYPVIPVEQAKTVGTVGDIMLADWSGYKTANKGGINTASSIHLKFDYNQTTFRFIYYFDGQPKLSAPITPANGTNTVSPFVVLATRG